ncbi:MAG TPA: hypothetical protein VEQ37_06295 [Actinomycetota bacterium]|nr:hypothetical protein [Actinomycetota bacterium]
MAHSHGPRDGPDRLPQNGSKGKHVAIALFVATTFGIMAILSFPLSRIGRLPLRLRNPLEAVLNPIERLIRPVIPRLGRPSGSTPPRVSVALAPRGPRGTAPSGRSGPGGRQASPLPAPRGGGALPTLTSPGLARPEPQAALTLAATLVRQLRTILSNRTTTLSPEQAKLIQAEISTLRSMSAACLADRTCARQLRLAERLLLKVDSHLRGRHDRKHGKWAHEHGAAEGTSQAPGKSSHGRGHARGNRHGRKSNGVEASGHSHKRHGSHGMHKKLH